MTSILCRIIGHWWKATHQNRWYVATRRVCRVCGRVECVKGLPRGFDGPEYVETERGVIRDREKEAQMNDGWAYWKIVPDSKHIL